MPVAVGRGAEGAGPARPTGAAMSPKRMPVSSRNGKLLPPGYARQLITHSDTISALCSYRWRMSTGSQLDYETGGAALWARTRRGSGSVSSASVTWGSKHLRVLRSTTGVANVVGVDQRFTRKGDCPQPLDVVGYTGIEQALPDVDAVVIATPPSTQARLSMQATEAGKHVLVEKPLATTSAEAQLVVDAAEDIAHLLLEYGDLGIRASIHVSAPGHLPTVTAA